MAARTSRGRRTTCCTDELVEHWPPWLAGRKQPKEAGKTGEGGGGDGDCMLEPGSGGAGSGTCCAAGSERRAAEAGSGASGSRPTLWWQSWC